MIACCSASHDIRGKTGGVKKKEGRNVVLIVEVPKGGRKPELEQDFIHLVLDSVYHFYFVE